MKKAYNKRELEIIHQYYPVIGCKWTLKKLKNEGFERSYKSLIAKAHKLNIKSGINHKKNSASFKKGNTPHNLGKKMAPYVYKRCSGTMFQKGIKSHTELYDGAIRPRLEKNTRVYLYIRQSKAKWKTLNKVFWERINGPIPPKHVLSFKSGEDKIFHSSNKELIDMCFKRRAGEKIDFSFLDDLTPEDIVPHLELISMKENVRRNQNRKKFKETTKWMTDKQIAGRLTMKHPEIRKEILNHKELIEVTRQRILLNRKIKQIKEDEK